jgi:voltage-gated potassium channel
MKKHTRFTFAGPRDLRLKTFLFLLILIISAGTVGYRVLEDWRWLDSFYMTIITISTVGFSEVGALSDAGRIHTIALILAGVGTLGVTLSILLEYIFQHQFQIMMEKRSMKKKIQTLKNHTIVCGYGRMGKIIADELTKANQPLVVVESSANKTEELESEGTLVIRGDATSETFLEQAGVSKASALVATLGTDADNLFLTLTARDMNPNLEIISRAESENNTRKFTQAGASRVVSPFAIGAGHIVTLLTRPTVIDFVDLITGDEGIKLEVAQEEVTADGPFHGRTLAEGHVRQELGGMVIAIRKADKSLLFDPRPETRMDAGDCLFVMRSSATTSPQQ